MDVISVSHGNTLAVCHSFFLIYDILLTFGRQYALTALQNLMELDYGWSSLEDEFISTVVQILSSPQNLINVCRPATAILKKLVEADPRSAPGPIMPSSSTRPPTAPPGKHAFPFKRKSATNIKTADVPSGSVYRYGFDCVYEQMSRQRGLLEIVVGRLGSADSVMGLNS
jgi:engulfment/cell motility protein 1